MPLQKLAFRPGVNRESTSYANEGGYYASNKIRFRSGMPEKVGGWVTDTGTTISSLKPTTEFEHKKHRFGVIREGDQPERNECNKMHDEIAFNVSPKYFTDVFYMNFLVAARSFRVVCNEH